MWRRGKSSLYFIGVVLMMTIIISGCTSSEPSWSTFVGAAVEKSYPVPKEANRTDAVLNNSKMDYVHYSFPGLREDDGVPEPYEKAISEWGWVERVEENTGTTTVYEKGKLIVQLTIHDDSFTVLVPKTDEKVVIQGIESSP
ncbi:hypothetical protein [Paenibacillus sp. FSL K6-2524]|uniref:hypothetical protein n=1 Tax=Paenibacillus sp. FSL K6-2524 TaxID=2954516 RepID=UPI0030FB654D